MVFSYAFPKRSLMIHFVVCLFVCFIQEELVHNPCLVSFSFR